MLKVEREHGYFKSREKGFEMTLDKKIFCVSGWGRNSKSTEQKQVVSREKTKFEMKIMPGKRKVKWAKRREGQNL